MKKAFFVDFDGTITRQDTCRAMVMAFAREGWQELNDLWQKKELPTEECARQTLKLFRATPTELTELMHGIEVDRYFLDFLQLCRSNNHPVYILSDGYDFMIEAILQRHCLDVPYYANKLIYKDGFDIVCPHLNVDCGQCGTCKKTLMETLASPGTQTIYIGDGYSDTCPASHADIVYAKGTLYQYCLQNGINAVEYRDFKDIILDLGIKKGGQS